MSSGVLGWNGPYEILLPSKVLLLVLEKDEGSRYPVIREWDGYEYVYSVCSVSIEERESKGRKWVNGLMLAVDEDGLADKILDNARRNLIGSGITSDPTKVRWDAVPVLMSYQAVSVKWDKSRG